MQYNFFQFNPKTFFPSFLSFCAHPWAVLLVTHLETMERSQA